MVQQIIDKTSAAYAWLGANLFKVFLGTIAALASLMLSLVAYTAVKIETNQVEMRAQFTEDMEHVFHLREQMLEQANEMRHLIGITIKRIEAVEEGISKLKKEGA